MSKKLSPAKTKLFSWLFILTGLFFIFIGIGIIPIDDPTLNSPKWVLGLCGFVFSLSGVMVLLGEKSPINNLLGGLLVLSFAIIGGWIAFFGDSAHFSGGTPILSDSQNVIVARILFGSGSLMCFFIFIYAIKMQFRSKKESEKNSLKK